MKKLRLLLLILIVGFLPEINAQNDTIRTLIFTEWRGGSSLGEVYHELTNVGTDTIDLSKFMVAWINGQNNQLDVDPNGNLYYTGSSDNQKIYLAGELAPGDTWTATRWNHTYTTLNDTVDYVNDTLYMNDTLWVNDTIPASGGGDSIIEVVDTILLVQDTIIEVPVIEVINIDSTLRHNPYITHLLDTIGPGGAWFNHGTHAQVLYNLINETDSVMVDVANLNLDENNRTLNIQSTVAGREEVTNQWTLVRKANITKGNPDWDASTGSTAEDSEWMLLFHGDQGWEKAFTTVGSHGVYDIDLTTDVEGIIIDEPNKSLTLPWGMLKGDSVIYSFEYGPGMAWRYIQDTTSIEDSAKLIVQDGDIFKVVAVGNELKEIDFIITVGDAPDDATGVYPIRYRIPVGETPPFGFGDQDEEWWVQPYFVQPGLPGAADTILGVDYGTRVDTLFKYLEKPPKATWEIVWMDGVENADLFDGDILRVTAEDGVTTKDYYIRTPEEYQGSINTALSAITWPDKNEFLEGWGFQGLGDTIPAFSPSNTAYQVVLPPWQTDIPALAAIPQNLNSNVEVKRATSLTGSQEDRSFVFTVRSEATDTIFTEYTVVLSIEREESKIQHYFATPIISEIVTNQYARAAWLEIANAGTVDLDLSDYLFVKGESARPVEDFNRLSPVLLSAPTDEEYGWRYRSYIPGYKYLDDTLNWKIDPGILQPDANVDPVIKPGGVFVMCYTAQNRWNNISDAAKLKIDKGWHNSEENLWYDETGTHIQNTMPYNKRQTESMYIYKITGDSIKTGLKETYKDYSDYELVEVFGDTDVTDDIWTIAGTNVIHNGRWSVRRKPHIFKGDTSMLDAEIAFGINADTSDWILTSMQGDDANADRFIGSHTMDVVTVHLSVVTSSSYLVSNGWEGDQTIQGDLGSLTVEGFFGNLDKADPGQQISVVSGAAKDSADAIVAATDTLVVVSADGSNTTRYLLIDQPLSSDAMLTLADDPSNYTIETDGMVGTITGVVYGSLLKDMVAAVVVPDFAIMSVINGEGELLPMRSRNFEGENVDALVGDDVYFEVRAQDGATIITYKLVPASLSSDAYVISAIYEVDQANNDIANIADATSISLFNNGIEVVKGATATIRTTTGQVRMDGQLAYDDVLQVVSEDLTVTKTYFLTFLNESNPEANTAPEITLAFSDSLFAAPGTIMLSATVVDDGLPPPGELTYLWKVTSDNGGDVVIANAESLSTDATFNAIGHYNISLSVSDGAITSEAAVYVGVGVVGINNALMPSLRLYPNPATDILNLELIDMPGKTTTVSIYNITGSIVYNTKVVTETVEIDVSGFNSGLYFIKVESGNHKFSQRVEILD